MYSLSPRARSLQINWRMDTAIDTNASWRDHLIETPDGIRRLIEDTHRIAVLGIKREHDRPAFYVPEYAQKAGYEIVPVPVFYPDATEILGEKVYRTVSAIPGDVDMVNVFRRPTDIPPHLDDIIAKKPKSVWFQLGIRNDAAAEKLARAGIDVVQDRCLLVELQRLGK
jgi:predicted CoA-binding protein